MSQSLANIVVHLVFSTKGRRPLLRDEEPGQLHAYITRIIRHQPEHHKQEDFQTEYRRFCEKNGKPLDERYAGDWIRSTGLAVGFVPPLQGWRNLVLDNDLGLRAARSTPGCHRTGFQPLLSHELLVTHSVSAESSPLHEALPDRSPRPTFNHVHSPALHGRFGLGPLARFALRRRT